MIISITPITTLAFPIPEQDWREELNEKALQANLLCEKESWIGREDAKGEKKRKSR